MFSFNELKSILSAKELHPCKIFLSLVLKSSTPQRNIKRAFSAERWSIKMCAETHWALGLSYHICYLTKTFMWADMT
jgi:hypothetical protein